MGGETGQLLNFHLKGMAACGLLGIFMTRKVLDSLSEVSRD